MPEIGEVARIVHYIRKHLRDKVVTQINAQDDANVFGKVGCSSTAFQSALQGKPIRDAGRQGKYFWMVMDSPPHPLMHFGMTGWFHIKNERTFYYSSKGEKKADDAEGDEEVWPPKYWKFALEAEGAEGEKVSAAFVDSRRFARIRLLDCAAEEIRKVTPLVENGPDPVEDKAILTEEWLVEKCLAKRVPIKALMLEQGNISGIGNWVG